MKGRRLVLVLAICVVASLSFSSQAFGLLYGLSSSNPGTLYTVHAGTGAATAVVSLSETVSFTGMAFLGNDLYATDVYTTGFRLGTIDVSTGVFTVVCDQDGSLNWHGLAADQSAGLLYAIDYDDGFKLKSTTPAGVVTTIGTGAGIEGRGMTYDDGNGIMYATGMDAAHDQFLYTVNKTAGTASLIGAMGLNTYRIGLAYDEVNDILYANDAMGGGLYTVNVGTGGTTLVGYNGTTAGAGIDGLAWSPVPEPATICLLGGALAGLALRFRRRRKDR